MPSPAPRRQFVTTFPTPRIQDTIFYELKDQSRLTFPEYGTKHPDSQKYPNHVLCHLEPAVDETGDWHKWWYIAERSAQDTYNWEFVKADIGGQKFDAVTRSYVTLREDFSSTTPAMGAPMPTTPTGVFSGTYVLAQRREVRSGDPKLDSLFVVDERTYVKRTSLVSNDYDEAFGGTLPVTQTLYYSTETVTTQTVDGVPTARTAAYLFANPTNTYWGLQSDGTVREGRQVSSDWYAITVRAVVPEPFATSGRSYLTTIDYTWPAVLSDIDVDTWERKDGGEETYFRPIYSKETYRGPCKALVSESFSKTAPTPSVPSSMLPLPIDMACPFFNISIGPTLHAEITKTVSTGTGHPIYEFAGGDWLFPATTPEDWDPHILASDEVRPFRGGYLRTTVTVYAPTFAALPP